MNEPPDSSRAPSPGGGAPRRAGCRPYRPPEVAEIVLDPDEALLTPCVSQVVSSPPCPPPNHSVIRTR